MRKTWAIILGLGIATTLGARAEDQVRVSVEKKELLTDEGAKPAPVAVPEKKAAEVKVSPEARAELAKITQAYQKLTSLELAGTMASDISVGGQVQNEKSELVGTFSAPNKFRHEMKGDIVVGSTGAKAYAFRPARNDYKVTDAPEGRVASDKFPSPMRDVLQMQDVGLMCALVEDAGKFLVEGASDVGTADDVKVEGLNCKVLTFKGEKMGYRVMVDATSHLVRQVVMDLKRSIEESGRDDVERAVLTLTYTSVKPGAGGAVDEKAFAWAPPQGARDAGQAQVEEGQATALVGKDAPDFKLNGMDGKPVVMKDQRGSVVVLDFWATWCGPCRQSLPGLNALYKEKREKGMKAFAVDLEEPKETIQPVAAKLIPDLPVLLDEKSEVSKLYGVSGIPQTVVVGKDGRVKKVLVGSGNEANIRAAVEAALRE